MSYCRVRLVGCRRSNVTVRCDYQNVTIAGSEFAPEAHLTNLAGALFAPHRLTYKETGCRVSRSQVTCCKGIFTTNSVPLPGAEIQLI